MNQNSQRSNTKFKPKFLRLKFLERKRALENLDVALDDDYVIRFYGGVK